MKISLLLIISIFFQSPIATAHKAKLEEARALGYSKLSLSCMDQDFPYKTDHIFSSSSDIKSQKDFHPAFYGCLDWHSAVHGHWALVRILDTFPQISNRAEIEKRLDAHFDPKLIAKENEIFKRDDQKRFERAYGYGWFLRLMMEVRGSRLPHQPRWLMALQPLEETIRGRFIDYLKVFDFPIRRGVHENSAFALAHAFDYAAFMKDQEFMTAVTATARKFYLEDVQCPLAFEPEGDDFISPCLAEADLMRRVLPPSEFKKWFDGFWPQMKNKKMMKFLKPLEPTSITDAKAVHLVGLDFYRAWTMESIAEVLPKGDARADLLFASSRHHAETGDLLIAKPGYEGSHWLASFAIYHFTGANSK